MVGVEIDEASLPASGGNLAREASAMADGRMYAASVSPATVSAWRSTRP